MFIGYGLNHAGDCYRMFNPKTGRVHITRDIKWLNRMYFKIVRFHTAENLIKLEAGKGIEYENSDQLCSCDDEAYGNFGDYTTNPANDQDVIPDEPGQGDENDDILMNQDDDELSNNDSDNDMDEDTDNEDLSLIHI